MSGDENCRLLRARYASAFRASIPEDASLLYQARNGLFARTEPYRRPCSTFGSDLVRSELFCVRPQVGVNSSLTGRCLTWVSNLLTNASKYTDQGGQISLSLQSQEGYAVVRVQDTGMGISAFALPTIFDLFVQADASSARSRSGVGVGLALVRKFVEMHGGSVTAHSAGLGQGSEFVVRTASASLERSDVLLRPGH
jgi:anti-sigma regulatory factor (Ser/Thr protein kinase)